ncbi:MAG: hypothetical protein JW909_05935 [Planctomycetes bacterium]|nr:hypothetical protein [Planctomycetota bacterium]
MPPEGRHAFWEIMDLTHGRSDGTLNPDPTRTDITRRVLGMFPDGAFPKYRYIWLLPQRDPGQVLREIADDDAGRSIDIMWAEIEQPSSGSFWTEWGVDNPVVELTVEERLFVVLAQVVVSKGYTSSRQWAASTIMRMVVNGRRRLSQRYSYLVPEKWGPAFEDSEEYIRFLGQPIIDPGSISETVNYLEF